MKTYEERGLTSEKFEELLLEIVIDDEGSVLDIPGVYEIVSEYFNNDVLAAFDEENPLECVCGGQIEEENGVLSCDECEEPREA